MFDLSKIINGLTDLKDTIEKNRVKNLRAELAGKFLDPKDIILVNEGATRKTCDEAVILADVLLRSLGETK